MGGLAVRARGGWPEPEAAAYRTCACACACAHTQVVETITELAQVMRDLSTLVVEQGTMLDRVDHNITEAAVKVGRAWRAHGSCMALAWRARMAPARACLGCHASNACPHAS